MKLFYNVDEINFIKSKVYFTSLEEQVLDMWLKGSTIVESSMKLNISISSVNRRRKSILKKIEKSGIKEKHNRD